ncbi:hypothetical protein BCR44DRAFT_1449702 [Catenaria anguillulae PL171]|uniref:Uncharacterized protein n=1 Tax=Catenaria anguillulae PL171 TaxID=765915 RepID=A0A1Y2H728_9FUNG|nr:hypothetical protein BCR44DRAFT_1449702 [Catenaria anguillulae PL171]
MRAQVHVSTASSARPRVVSDPSSSTVRRPQQAHSPGVAPLPLARSRSPHALAASRRIGAALLSPPLPPPPPPPPQARAQSPLVSTDGRAAAAVAMAASSEVNGQAHVWAGDVEEEEQEEEQEEGEVMERSHAQAKFGRPNAAPPATVSLQLQRIKSPNVHARAAHQRGLQASGHKPDAIIPKLANTDPSLLHASSSLDDTQHAHAGGSASSSQVSRNNLAVAPPTRPNHLNRRSHSDARSPPPLRSVHIPLLTSPRVTSERTLTRHDPPPEISLVSLSSSHRGSSRHRSRSRSTSRSQASSRTRRTRSRSRSRSRSRDRAPRSKSRSRLHRR